jgi:hypothetical protein
MESRTRSSRAPRLICVSPAAGLLPAPAWPRAKGQPASRSGPRMASARRRAARRPPDRESSPPASAHRPLLSQEWVEAISPEHVAPGVTRASSRVSILPKGLPPGPLAVAGMMTRS